MSGEPLVDALAAAFDPSAAPVVVDVSVGDQCVWGRASGAADRRAGRPNGPDVSYALASGAKSFTALTVASLVADGALSWDDPIRRWLGDDLPLVDDRVTVLDLVTHRSGIGDYLDESAGGEITDYVMPVPVHRLADSAGYLEVIDGFPQVAEPGSTFAYNNGGFVALAIVAERAGRAPFHDLVEDRVIRPGGLTATGYWRSDELPADAAIGYLGADGDRTNVHHLPVRGHGDGGIYASVDDVRSLWLALFAGRVVPADVVVDMTTPVTPGPASQRYGRGFWLAASGPVVQMEGYDAGVSFVSLHDPTSATTVTVVSNTSEGAWPLARVARDALGDVTA